MNSATTQINQNSKNYSVFATETFLLFVTLLWIFKVYYTKRHGKKGTFNMFDLPGPRQLPILGNTFQLIPPTQTIKNIVKISQETDGDLGLIRACGLHFVFMNSPSSVEKLLKSSHLGHTSRIPYIYDLFRDLSKNNVVVTNGLEWKSHRKAIVRSMTLSYLRGYVGLMNKHSEFMCRSLEELFRDGQHHPVDETLNAASFGIICETATGADFQDTETGRRFHDNLTNVQQNLSYRLLHPWFIPKWLWRLHPKSFGYNKCIKEIDQFVSHLITEHKIKCAAKPNKDVGTGYKGSHSVLDNFVAEGLSDEEILDELKVLISVGHDTTATSIHYLCLLLALNPKDQEKCRQEVDDLYNTHDPDCINYDSLSQLKYLEMCILENLRLFPVNIAFGRRFKVPLDIGNGVEIPSEANVLVFPIAIHRNPKNFSNPEKFLPERFSPGNIKHHPYAFIPFSMGSRNCLGYKFAMLELKVLAVHILRNFVITTTTKFEDIVLLPNLTVMIPETRFSFRFEKRKF